MKQMRLNWMWGFLGGLFLLGNLRADLVEVTVERAREQYLLYEPIDLRITLRNNSGHDLVFEDPGNGRGWLDFIVTNEVTHGIVMQDQTEKFNKLTLEADQSRSLVVNVTPLYNIRASGSYTIQVAVQVAGHEFVTAPTEVIIVNGQTIWQKKKAVNGSMRTYSLIRFTPGPDSTFIYLRVEDEEKNVVYTTENLGEIISYSDPATAFDSEGNLHLIYVSGKDLFRYVRVDPSGQILAREPYSAIDDNRPQLFTTQDGSVLVQGGRKEDASTARELLSKGQSLLRKAPVPVLPPGAVGNQSMTPTVSVHDGPPPAPPSTDSTPPQ